MPADVKTHDQFFIPTLMVGRRIYGDARRTFYDGRRKSGDGRRRYYDDRRNIDDGLLGHSQEASHI